ncbi:MAG: D-alanyl-D-alanine carboxypeptidase family protein [Acidobacteria bacterium]|nr:D-alanyl-D-alanine carboxypeptidase family protein [Acidobacteriota bacterium]
MHQGSLIGLCLLLVAANLSAGPPAPAKKPSLDARAFYGYGPFEQAEESQLESVGERRASGRVVKLAQPAAQAFREMQAAALRDGVVIVPISGFREREHQARLFWRAVRRHGSQRKAARWVAPPGFSYHEAGLALDLGDENEPQCDVRGCFRKTPAFAWLMQNADRFGFQLSRPRNSTSRRPREPWHWNYSATDEVAGADDATRSD